MEVGISTACFYPSIKTEDTIGIISSLGFNLCEVFLETEFEMSEQYCYDLRNKAEKVGLSIHSVHAFNSYFEPYLFDRYERRRNEMESRFIKVCKAGSILGAKYYTFHGITSTMNNGSIDTIALNIGRLCEIAKENGITLSQENVSWCRSNDPEYIRQLKIKNQNLLSYTLDVKQAVRSKRTPEEFLEVYQDRLSTVHINDASEDSACLLPGKGDMNIYEIMKKAQQLNPEAPFILEVYCENYKSYDELAQAKEYVKNYSKYR